jgi:competence protein ComEC
VHPRIAVISAGEDNPYSHPSPELLDRLNNAQIRILRTDKNGAIHILMDSNTIEVSCFVACPRFAENGDSAQTQAPNQN